jgi:hypothetical protein
MDPVIIATKVSDANGDGNINDDLALEASLSGTVQFDPMAFIFCTNPPTVEDFVPTATAQTLVDEFQQPIVRTGTVGADGTFAISPMTADVYDLGFVTPMNIDGVPVTFAATVNLESVEVVGGPVDGVVYTITEVACGFSF